MAKKTKPDRREKIVQAAIACFAKSGVAQTRMSEIASAAKVDQPLIGYYFPTPEALYAEVVARVLDDLKTASLAAIEKGGSDLKKVLSSYVRANFDWGKRNPGYFSIWMYFYYLAAYQPKFVELSRQIRETGRERIAFMIYSGIEKGIFKIPPGMSVPEVALAIQGIITGIGIMAGTEGGQPWDKFSDNAVLAVQTLLGSK